MNRVCNWISVGSITLQNDLKCDKWSVQNYLYKIALKYIMWLTTNENSVWNLV